MSDYIRELPFLWVEVADEPSPDTHRGVLERNMIALVSNFGADPVHPRGDPWLGHFSPHQKIRESGLWNVNHVEEDYDSSFLDLLKRYIQQTPIS